jgi:uncharacterized protein YbjT (DUF2867 family)
VNGVRGTNPAAAGPIAVTGALGFVASRLLPRLGAGGRRVIGIVRPGRSAPSLERLGVEVRFADLTRPEGLEGAFAGAAGVVHLSGMSQVTLLVPALERCGVRRGVFVGSTGIYTRLESPGAEAKRVGEARLRASAIDFVILRPSMIYGTERDRNLARLLRWLGRMPIVPLPGGGGTPQQPIHVDDLCAAILAALDRPEAARREFDVGGPESLTLAELVRAAGRAMGRRVWLVPIPLAPVHAAARLFRWSRVPFPVSPEQVLRLRESKSVDITAARTALGFDPRPFADGIAAEARSLSESGR